MMVTINENADQNSLTINVSQTIDRELFQRLSVDALAKAMDQIVDQVVEEIVKQKMGEVLSKVDTQAVANLAIARAATRIADELGKSK